MEKKTIRIMIGLPRSGKSTWVEKNKTNEVVVSADNLRYLVYNQRFWSNGEPMMWAVRKIFLKYLMQQGVNIIVDETNITIDSRKQIISLAKEYGYHIIAHFIGVPCVDVYIQRAKNSNQEDLIPIIKKMEEQFELPSKEEGFDELYLGGMRI